MKFRKSRDLTYRTEQSSSRKIYENFNYSFHLYERTNFWGHFIRQYIYTTGTTTSRIIWNYYFLFWTTLMWLFRSGHVGMWVCGCVGMWVCG